MKIAMIEKELKEQIRIAEALKPKLIPVGLDKVPLKLKLTSMQLKQDQKKTKKEEILTPELSEVDNEIPVDYLDPDLLGGLTAVNLRAP